LSHSVSALSCAELEVPQFYFIAFSNGIIAESDIEMFRNGTFRTAKSHGCTELDLFSVHPWQYNYDAAD